MKPLVPTRIAKLASQLLVCIFFICLATGLSQSIAGLGTTDTHTTKCCSPLPSTSSDTENPTHDTDLCTFEELVSKQDHKESLADLVSITPCTTLLLEQLPPANDIDIRPDISGHPPSSLLYLHHYNSKAPPTA